MQYTLPRLKLFGANDAEVYYYPEFTQPEDANTYEPKPGAFVSLKDNVDDWNNDPHTTEKYSYDDYRVIYTDKNNHVWVVFKTFNE